jgi:hypothetical protein
MMAPLPRLLVFALGLTVLLLVINLVRKRQLQERYAILWLLAGLALTLAPVFIPWLDHLAFSLGFEYPPALLLLLAVVGLLLLIFQLSLTISRNEDRIKVLTQELGLLRHAVATLQRTAAEVGDSTQPAQQETTVEPDHD